MAEVTQAQVMAWFNYDQETGDLIVKERPQSSFKRLCDYRLHVNSRVGKPAGAVSARDGYVQVYLDGKLYKAHRLIWLLVHGEMPKFPDFEIDHIDRNRANNRLSNLRVVDKLGNCRNSSLRSDNTSGYKGVGWCNHKQRWVARIKASPERKVVIGYFKDVHDAATARALAEQIYWGAL